MFVSIPFKRESVFRGQRSSQKRRCQRFQFPSNGKVYSEWKTLTKISKEEMFQFPSNGKVYSEEMGRSQQRRSRNKSFNSLQTGKCIQRKENVL